MAAASWRVVKLQAIDDDIDTLNRVMGGERVVVVLQHTGYRDGTEAELHLTTPTPEDLK